MSARDILVTIGPNPPDRLDKALARDVPAEAGLSRSRIAALLAEGAISSEGDVVSNPKARTETGTIFVIRLAEAQDVELAAQDIPLDIRFEDDALLVINKPAGMVVHPAPGSPDGTLVNALLAHSGDSLSGIGGEKRPGIVHRIDKGTSGLLVVAKTQAAHTALAAQFEAHQVERVYDALCYGVPDRADPRLQGVRGVSFEPGGVIKITSGLQRHRTDRQRQAVVFGAGRRAVTRVSVVKDFGALARVECRLETGRTHQIRVHMAHIGHGLVGDPTYGGRRRVAAAALPASAREKLDALTRQALHARVLGFCHPVSGEKIRFEAELPEDLASLIDELKGQ